MHAPVIQLHVQRFGVTYVEGVIPIQKLTITQMSRSYCLSLKIVRTGRCTPGFLQ